MIGLKVRQIRQRVFCHIFPYRLLEVHLTKETAKIPEVVARQLGWIAEIVHCGGDPLSKLRHKLEQEIPHVRLRDIRGYGDGRFEPALLQFLWANARRIDVLMLMHFGRNTPIYGTVYKFLNPRGFLWNKLDLHEEWVESAEFFPRATWHPRRAARAWLNDWYARQVDLVSAENNAVYQLLANRYPKLAGKLALLQCGVDALTMPSSDSSGSRKPLILNVARLGTEQKATDVLLEAFARSKLWPEWTLVLVGPVETEFQSCLKAFAARHAEAWRAVRMIGPVTSRQELADWYKRSLVFCMPSRYESWGLALNEAGYYGCACVSTNFSAAIDMLDGGRCGALCAKGSVHDLANALVQVCRNEKLIDCYSHAFQQRVMGRFTWDRVIQDWHAIVATRRMNL